MKLSAQQSLREEIERLKSKLEEPQQTLEAIRHGRVDAFVIEDEVRQRVYTLKDLDPPYRLIVEEMREGAAALGSDSTLVYCNAQFERLSGRSRNDMLGRPFRFLLDRDQRPTFDAFFALLAGGGARSELVLHGVEGEVPVQVSGSRLVDNDEILYVLILTDIRERRHREEMRAAKEAAEQANRAKDEFLATVSHEVRAPITSILGWIRMMQMNLVDPENHASALEKIAASTMALSKLVDDILDVSRLNSGKLSLQMERIDDLSRVVHSVCEALSPAVAEKNIYVKETLSTEPLPVYGDADRLRQVFSNILSNALKFTPSNGHVSVSVERAGSNVRVAVEDTGEGIAPEFLPHVFERFQQGKKADSRRYGGLGLGLFIVKQLVEEHRGRVDVQSRGAGYGTTVIVELPGA